MQLKLEMNKAIAMRICTKNSSCCVHERIRRGWWASKENERNPVCDLQLIGIKIVFVVELPMDIGYQLLHPIELVELVD